MRSPKKVLPEIKAKLYEDDAKHVEIISDRLAALGSDASNSGVIRYALEQTALNSAAIEARRLLKKALGVEDEKTLQTQTEAALLKLLTQVEKLENFFTDFGHVRNTVNVHVAQNEAIKFKLDSLSLNDSKLSLALHDLSKKVDESSRSIKTSLAAPHHTPSRALAEPLLASDIAPSLRATGADWRKVIADNKEVILKALSSSFYMSRGPDGRRIVEKEKEDQAALELSLDAFPPLSLEDCYLDPTRICRIKVGFVFEYGNWDVAICQTELRGSQHRYGYIVSPRAASD